MLTQWTKIQASMQSNCIVYGAGGVDQLKNPKVSAEFQSGDIDD